MKNKIIALMLCLFFTNSIVSAETFDKSAPKTIIVAPPAPKFTDAERQTELGKRRADVLKKMKPNSVFMLQSAEPRNYANDVDFYYRQENNLYYLTNLKQNGATLFLIKKGDNSTQEMLFLPLRSPRAEMVNGRMYSNEDATRISGIKEIVGSVALGAVLQAYQNKAGNTGADKATPQTTEIIYLLLPNDGEDVEGFAEFRREQELAKTLTAYKIENARPMVDDLRLYKSQYELKLMQYAIDITTEAQMRSMGMVGKAKFEYEVQAEVEYTFRRRNADYWGYPSIVGCGPNATTLHYVESQGAVKSGDLMLMDVGAEYDHYTADVTRTYPVNGKFSKEQAEIYQIVYDAQEAVAKIAKPGVTFKQLGDAAAEVAKDRLFKLGLITDKNSNQYRVWYLHGLGHWLGMNVHDVGSYSEPMQAGIVFTNEPGIYFREDALDNLPKTAEWQAFVEKVRPNFEKYKNIGVRIEDDLLVTRNGVEWMTKNLPRKISDVEAFMASASKEMAFNNLPQAAKPQFAILNFDTNIFLNTDYNPNTILSGKTIRRGWISAGKDTANAGLKHIEHAHGE